MKTKFLSLLLVCIVSLISVGYTTTPEARQLHVSIAWSKHDHAKGTHSYPEFAEKWKKICAPLERVTVESVKGFPEEEQWEKSDLMILYMTNRSHDKEMNDIMRRHLDRGASVMLLHQALVVYKGEDQGWADNLGYSYSLVKKDKSKYRKMAMDISIDSSHVITQNLPKAIQSKDELYWRLLKGGLGKTTVLATCKPLKKDWVEWKKDGDDKDKEWPVFWITEHGKNQENGRVFVSVIGHYDELFQEPWFHNTLVRGMGWTLKEPLSRFKALEK